MKTETYAFDQSAGISRFFLAILIAATTTWSGLIVFFGLVAILFIY